MLSKIEKSVLENVLGSELLGATVQNIDGLRSRVDLTFAIGKSISIRANCESDEIEISTTNNVEWTTEGEINQLIQSCIGKRLYNWWRLSNNADMCDGVLLAFGPDEGILFSIMASE